MFLPTIRDFFGQKLAVDIEHDDEMYTNYALLTIVQYLLV